MKKLANISSFESLATSNATFVNNSYARRPVNNSIFSKGAAGDVGRALMAKRGLALIKEGVGLMAQVGIRGGALLPLLIGSAADVVTRIPLTIAETVRGRGPREDYENRIPAKIAEIGETMRDVTRDAPEFVDSISDRLREWADEDKEAIGRLRAIKAKGRRYKK